MIQYKGRQLRTSQVDMSELGLPQSSEWIWTLHGRYHTRGRILSPLADAGHCEVEKSIIGHS